jgi:hypothetical protein
MTIGFGVRLKALGGLNTLPASASFIAHWFLSLLSQVIPRIQHDFLDLSQPHPIKLKINEKT